MIGLMRLMKFYELRALIVTIYASIVYVISAVVF